MRLAVAFLLLAMGAPQPAEPTEVGFSELASFDYEEGMDLPSEVTKYDGTEIKISGFMRREDGGDGPTDYFMLVYDACGCEGTPMLNEAIFCGMADGSQVDIAVGTATVTGTLYVGEETDDGIVVSLYTMEVDSVSS